MMLVIIGAPTVVGCSSFDGTMPVAISLFGVLSFIILLVTAHGPPGIRASSVHLLTLFSTALSLPARKPASILPEPPWGRFYQLRGPVKVL